MSQSPESPSALNDIGLNETKSAANGTVDPVFTTTSAVDDESRSIFEKAAKSLFYSDRSLRSPTHAALRLLDQALETGNPDALVLKGLARQGLESDASIYLKDAERKGCKHPLLYYTLGKRYLVKLELEKAFGYIERAIGGK